MKKSKNPEERRVYKPEECLHVSVKDGKTGKIDYDLDSPCVFSCVYDHGASEEDADVQATFYSNCPGMVILQVVDSVGGLLSSMRKKSREQSLLVDLALAKNGIMFLDSVNSPLASFASLLGGSDDLKVPDDDAPELDD